MRPLRLGPQFRQRLGFALTATPILVQAAVVWLYGVNSPNGDELNHGHFVRLVHEHGNWLPLVFAQYNEHRWMLWKLELVVLSGWTGWNVLAEMYFNVLLAALVVWGLWKIYRASGGESVLRFSPQAWIVCSLGQWFNITDGFQAGFYFTLVGWVWAVYFLTLPKPRDLVYAILFGLGASYSALNGLLIWPAGFVQLLLSRDRRARLVCWATAGAASTVAYFWSFHRSEAPATPLAALSHPFSAFIFFLRVVGGPIAAGNLSAALVFGVVVTIAAVVGRRGAVTASPAGMSFLLVGFGSAAMIAAGRLSYGLPLESRFITFSNVILLGLLFFRANSPVTGGRLVLVIAIVFGFAATEIHGLAEAETFSDGSVHRKWMLQTYRSFTDERLRSVFVEVPDLREILRYLEANRLSVFRDPVDALFLERWREGHPARNILPGRPVIQNFLCPVDRLRDVSVPFATYQRENSCHVMIRLSSDTARLGAAVVPCRDIKDNSRVVLDIPRALQPSSGAGLRIEIESPDATPENSVTVWTYPGYYTGTLFQPGNPDTAGHGLGIEINAHRRHPIFRTRG